MTRAPPWTTGRIWWPDHWRGMMGVSRNPSDGVRLMPHHSDVSRWLDRCTLWQFALIWWAFGMTCSLLGFATAMLWQHGGQLHRGPFIGALFMSSVTAVSAVWA